MVVFDTPPRWLDITKRNTVILLFLRSAGANGGSATDDYALLKKAESIRSRFAPIARMYHTANRGMARSYTIWRILRSSPGSQAVCFNGEPGQRPFLG